MQMRKVDELVNASEKLPPYMLDGVLSESIQKHHILAFDTAVARVPVRDILKMKESLLHQAHQYDFQHATGVLSVLGADVDME